jgi:hypothetical protein
MKVRLNAICLTVGCLLVVSPALNAQTTSSRLKVVGEDVRRLVSEKKPDWKHTSVEPMPGSEDVIVEQWAHDDQAIKVAIIEHKSQAEAEETFGRLVSEARRNRKDGLGDDGYVLNERGDIAFRKGRLTIYVSVVAKNTSDRPTISKEFASLVATIK